MKHCEENTSKLLVIVRSAREWTRRRCISQRGPSNKTLVVTHPQHESRSPISHLTPKPPASHCFHRLVADLRSDWP